MSVTFTLVAVSVVAVPPPATSDGVDVAEAAAVQVLTVESAIAPVVERDDFVVTARLIWPVPTNDLSSNFGERNGGFHAGADWTPGKGTPIRAIASGVVVESKYAPGGWGQYVTVEHRINGVTVRSLYAHMLRGSRTVKVGDQVAQGDVLGKVGTTGKSTGEHLHFEIHVGGQAVDPIKWMRANGAR